MEKSEEINELAKALGKFQSEISGAKKGSENPFFKSKYANLEEVISCAKEALMGNGLSVSQFPITEERSAGVETILMHTSGQWISGKCLLACAKVDPQGMGSAITYARRYAYQSILGIPAEDDDGNNVSQPVQEKPKDKQKPAPKTDKQKSEEIDTLSWIDAISKAGTLDELKTIFTRCHKSGGTCDEIIAAKDARKEQLEILKQDTKGR